MKVENILGGRFDFTFAGVLVHPGDGHASQFRVREPQKKRARRRLLQHLFRLLPPNKTHDGIVVPQWAQMFARHLRDRETKKKINTSFLS